MWKSILQGKDFIKEEISFQSRDGDNAFANKTQTDDSMPLETLLSLQGKDWKYYSEVSDIYVNGFLVKDLPAIPFYL